MTTKNIKTQIDLGDTLKCMPYTLTHTHILTHTVYINHRPAFVNSYYAYNYGN